MNIHPENGFLIPKALNLTHIHTFFLTTLFRPRASLDEQNVNAFHYSVLHTFQQFHWVEYSLC